MTTKSDSNETRAASSHAFAFGSSTPREFAHIPARASRAANFGAPFSDSAHNLAYYMRQARSITPGNPTNRTKCWAFGSSTPREFSHLSVNLKASERRVNSSKRAQNDKSIVQPHALRVLQSKSAINLAEKSAKAEKSHRATRPTPLSEPKETKKTNRANLKPAKSQVETTPENPISVEQMDLRNGVDQSKKSNETEEAEKLKRNLQKIFEDPQKVAQKEPKELEDFQKNQKESKNQQTTHQNNPKDLRNLEDSSDLKDQQNILRTNSIGVESLSQARPEEHAEKEIDNAESNREVYNGSSVPAKQNLENQLRHENEVELFSERFAIELDQENENQDENQQNDAPKSHEMGENQDSNSDKPNHSTNKPKTNVVDEKHRNETSTVESTFKETC